MTWTTVPTVTTGDLATAAQWNTYIRDNLNGAWGTWTPSYANLTVGSGGVSVGRFVQLGNLVHFYWSVTLGTAPTVGDVSVSLPVTARSVPVNTVLGHASFVDASAGSTYAVLARQLSTTTFDFRVSNTGTHVHNLMSSTVPFTWAVSDVMIVYGFYETG